MNENNLATELLHEIKASARRWFIAFCIMVMLEILTIIGFMWYMSLPTEETYIEQDSDNDSENTIIGGDYNGFETEGNKETQSNPK